MGLNPLPCFHSNYFLPVTFSIWVKINNTQRTLEFRNMQIGRLRYEFTSLDFKKCPVWGTSQRSRLLAEVFGLALGWLCWIVSPLLCDQYPSLCLNQRPAEVFAGCYLNDTKVRFENRAAVEARLTAGLAMNHTWVQINVALLANRDSTEILMGEVVSGACASDPQRYDQNTIPTAYFAGRASWKIVTPVLLILVVKHWNKILCNMHNQMLE